MDLEGQHNLVGTCPSEDSDFPEGTLGLPELAGESELFPLGAPSPPQTSFSLVRPANDSWEQRFAHTERNLGFPKQWTTLK